MACGSQTRILPAQVLVWKLYKCDNYPVLNRRHSFFLTPGVLSLNSNSACWVPSPSSPDFGNLLLQGCVCVCVSAKGKTIHCVKLPVSPRPPFGAPDGGVELPGGRTPHRLALRVLRAGCEPMRIQNAVPVALIGRVVFITPDVLRNVSFMAMSQNQNCAKGCQSYYTMPLHLVSLFSPSKVN